MSLKTHQCMSLQGTREEDKDTDGGRGGGGHVTMEVETGVMQPQTRATSGHQELEVVGRSLQRQRGPWTSDHRLPMPLELGEDKSLYS